MTPVQEMVFLVGWTAVVTIILGMLGFLERHDKIPPIPEKRPREIGLAYLFRTILVLFGNGLWAYFAIARAAGRILVGGLQWLFTAQNGAFGESTEVDDAE